jgi:hypothetical protein
MMNRFFALALVIVGAAALAWPVAAPAGLVTITNWDHDGNGTESGNGADLEILNGTYQDQNLDTYHLAVTNRPSADDAKAYIRFDLSAFANYDGDANTKLELAMKFFGRGTSDPTTQEVGFYGLNDGATGTTGITAWDEGWDETTVTWNQGSPANDGTPGGLDSSKVTFLGSYVFTNTMTTETYYTMNLSGGTTTLGDFLDADTDKQITIIMVAPTPQNTVAGVYNKESNEKYAEPDGSLAPRLTFTVPEPTTLGLLGLGGLLMLLPRRKR